MVAMVRECEAAEGERVSRIRERAKEIIEYAVGGRELFDKKRAFAALASNAQQAEMVELEDANHAMVAKANALVLKGLLMRKKMSFLMFGFSTWSRRATQAKQQQLREEGVRVRCKEILSVLAAQSDAFDCRSAFSTWARFVNKRQRRDSLISTQVLMTRNILLRVMNKKLRVAWSSWKGMVAMVRECEAAEGERVSRIRERAKEIIEYAVGGRELFDKKLAFAALASNARQVAMAGLQQKEAEIMQMEAKFTEDRAKLEADNSLKHALSSRTSEIEKERLLEDARVANSKLKDAEREAQQVQQFFEQRKEELEDKAREAVLAAEKEAEAIKLEAENKLMIAKEDAEKEARQNITQMTSLHDANYAMVAKANALVLKGLLMRNKMSLLMAGFSTWEGMVARVRECEAVEHERVSRIRERAKEIIEYAVGGRELFDKKRAFAALASNARQAEMVELEDANCEMVAKANALVLKGILLRVMSKKMRMAFLSWAYATASLREQVWQKEEKEGCIRERAREIIEFVVSGRDSYNKKRAFIALVSNLRDGMMADFLKEQCIVVSKANALVLKGLLTRKKAALQMAAFSTWSRRTTNLKQQQLRDEQQGEREME